MNGKIKNKLKQKFSIFAWNSQAKHFQKNNFLLFKSHF